MAVAVAIAVAFPAQARSEGTSPGGFASADSGGRSITGKAAGDSCTARLSGRELFCHLGQPDTQSVDTTPPRGEDNPGFAAGYAGLQSRPAFVHVSGSLATAPPLQIPRFLFGSFRS